MMLSRAASSTLFALLGSSATRPSPLSLVAAEGEISDLLGRWVHLDNETIPEGPSVSSLAFGANQAATSIGVGAVIATGHAGAGGGVGEVRISRMSDLDGTIAPNEAVIAGENDGDQFGRSVGVEMRYEKLAVGAEGYAGAGGAYSYRLSTSGEWEMEGNVMINPLPPGDDAVADTGFGQSVARILVDRKDFVIVCAPADYSFEMAAGRCYPMILRQSANDTSVLTWELHDSSMNDWVGNELTGLGYSLAAADGWVVMGGPTHTGIVAANRYNPDESVQKFERAWRYVGESEECGRYVAVAPSGWGAYACSLSPGKVVVQDFKSSYAGPPIEIERAGGPIAIRGDCSELCYVTAVVGDGDGKVVKYRVGPAPDSDGGSTGTIIAVPATEELRLGQYGPNHLAVPYWSLDMPEGVRHLYTVTEHALDGSGSMLTTLDVDFPAPTDAPTDKPTTDEAGSTGEPTSAPSSSPTAAPSSAQHNNHGITVGTAFIAGVIVMMSALLF